MTYHIAQLNIAKMVAPLDDPIMQGFINALEPINTIADNTAGFVWRLQDGGDATSIQAFEDKAILVNMSVWASLDALKGFVYRSTHVAILRNKKQWFEPLGGPSLVLWWIKQGCTPSIAEGKRRLETLSSNGPSPDAFTFSPTFPPPGPQ